MCTLKRPGCCLGGCGAVAWLGELPYQLNSVETLPLDACACWLRGGPSEPPDATPPASKVPGMAQCVFRKDPVVAAAAVVLMYSV